jgi:hypothetical protein
MNFRETKSFVYSLLADPGEEKVQFGEILSYINIGQSVLATAIWNIEREFFLGINTFQTKAAPGASDQTLSAAGDYLAPTDLNQFCRVVLNGVECNRHPVRELNALNKNTLYRATKGTQQFFSVIGDSIGRTKFRVFPPPIEADTVDVWYFKKPTDFHEQGSYEGTTTALGGAAGVSLIDTALPQANANGDATFWVNGEVRITNGTLIGQKRRISTFTPGTGTCTLQTAFPIQLPIGTTYEIDQVSIIPSQHHHLIGYYAAALGAPKAGADPQQFWQVWNDHLNILKRKYQDNIEANIAGESMTGVRSASV